MKYLRDSIPFLTKLRVGLACGWANRKAAWAMYSSILHKARTDWEEKDWKAELRSFMFSSGNSIFKDTSWKAMRRIGMSRKRWRLLSAKDVPVERPDKWDAAARRRAISLAILPEAYLRRFGGGKLLKRAAGYTSMLREYFDELVRNVREKSTEELSLIWALSKPDVNPEDLACLLFMGWCSATAWAEWQRRQSLGTFSPTGTSGAFYDWGFGTEFYRKTVELMRETDVFDAALGERFLQALSACARWYARPHAITGMFSILGPSELLGRPFRIIPQMVFGARLESFVMSLNSRFNPFAKSGSLMADDALSLPDVFREVISLKRKDADK